MFSFWYKSDILPKFKVYSARQGSHGATECKQSREVYHVLFGKQLDLSIGYTTRVLTQHITKHNKINNITAQTYS